MAEWLGPGEAFCPRCGARSAASAHTCDNCGWEFGFQAHGIEADAASGEGEKPGHALGCADDCVEPACIGDGAE